MRLKTPQGPLVLLPYPVVTVDVGQNLAQMKTPSEIETNWLDYVLELADEAHTAPAEATTVVIGIHPFVVGTPDGATALRRVLSRLSPRGLAARHRPSIRQARHIASTIAAGLERATVGLEQPRPPAQR